MDTQKVRVPIIYEGIHIVYVSFGSLNDYFRCLFFDLHGLTLLAFQNPVLEQLNGSLLD